MLTDSSGDLVAELRRALGPRPHLLAPDGFFDLRLARQVGPAVEDMTASVPGAPVDQLRGAGQRFVKAFTRMVGEGPAPYR